MLLSFTQWLGSFGNLKGINVDDDERKEKKDDEDEENVEDEEDDEHDKFYFLNWEDFVEKHNI